MNEKKGKRTRNSLRNTILMSFTVLLASIVILSVDLICTEGWCQSDSNTLLLLHFDEEAGNPQDSSKYNNTVTNSDAAYISSGKFNNALSFDGVDGEVLVKHNSIFSNSEELTVEAWVYFNSAPTSAQVIIAKDIWAGGDREWGLGFDESSNRLHCRLFNSDDDTAAAYIDLTARKWNHVAMTWDGTTIKTYLNGVFQNSQELSGVRKKGGSDITVGWQKIESAGKHFNGIIDEVRISNVARTKFSTSDGYYSDTTASPRPDNDLRVKAELR